MNLFARGATKLLRSVPVKSVQTKSYGLGRRKAPDVRDELYPIRTLLEEQGAEASTRKYRYWSTTSWWGDQGATPQCVGYAWAAWLEDGPVTHRNMPAPIVTPQAIYEQAKTFDEWEGEDYDGTSVRAGAKVLSSMGLISEYRWGQNIDTIILALLEAGPIVFGTNWYDSMFYPDSEGVITIAQGARVAGGHAFKVDGVSLTKGLARGKQSWGRGWGKNGHFYISLEDLERLLQEDGEACLAVEVQT